MPSTHSPSCPEQPQEWECLNMVGGKDKSLFVITYLTQADFPWLLLLIFATFYPLDPIKICFFFSCPVPGRWCITSIRHKKLQKTQVGRDFWRWPSQISVQKNAKVPQVAKGHVLLSFECPQVWRVHNLSRQSLPVLDHPHGGKNPQHLISIFPVVACVCCHFS